MAAEMDHGLRIVTQKFQTRHTNGNGRDYRVEVALDVK